MRHDRPVRGRSVRREGDARCAGRRRVGGASEIGVPDPADLLRVVRTALAEDLRYGPDATTAATVPADAVAVGAFTARAGGVLAGVPAVRAVLSEVLGDEVRGGDGACRTAPGWRRASPRWSSAPPSAAC